MHPEILSDKQVSLLREQLSFFDDIDYTERIDFMGTTISESVIREFLITCATSPFLKPTSEIIKSYSPDHSRQ
jgi:hypothetical protein